ncbi:MAG: hypothetical protein ACHQ1D_01245 [Nitrososphaerales archaeon]
MPSYRMILMSSETKEAFDNISEMLRKLGLAIPEFAQDYYMIANMYQEVVDQIWDSGFVIDRDELLRNTEAQ